MIIRPAAMADQDEIDWLILAAFGADHGHEVVAMVSALGVSGASRASLIAVRDDVIIGHVQLSRGWVDARRELVEVLVLSPLSVRPDDQRLGVGTRLIDAALAEAEQLGAPAVFLEGDWRYYGPRGFRPAAAEGFGAPSDRIPDLAFQVVVLPARQQWMRGRLIYPEAFWRTDTVGLRDPLLADVEAAGSERSGQPRE